MTASDNLKALYRIPPMWIAGYLLAHQGATVMDAVEHWLAQERLEREHGRQAHE
jgi:hypothetical protein